MKVAAQRTPVSPEAMTAALGVAWLTRYHTPPKPESLAVCLSQWAVETGRGRSMMNFNVGNVKSPSLDVPHCYFTTAEYLSAEEARRVTSLSTPERPCKIDSNGSPRNPNERKVIFSPDHSACRFRAFSTLDEGCAFYLQKMAERFHAAWASVLAGDLDSFGIALKQARYFTAPLDIYLRNLKGHYPLFFDLASDTVRLNTVRGWQMGLKKLGFDPGEVDDMFGPKTKRAIMAYQAARRLHPSGNRDKDTEAKLKCDLHL